MSNVVKMGGLLGVLLAGLAMAYFLGALPAVGAWAAWRAPGVEQVRRAWQRVQHAPDDALAWAALADAQTTMDDLRAAEHAYRTALRIAPNDGDLHARLGFLLYGAGEFAAARAALLQGKTLGARLPLLDYTIAQLGPPTSGDDMGPLLDAPDSPEMLAKSAADAKKSSREKAPAPCSIAVQRLGQRGTFTVQVLVAGKPARLIVDTGASISTLNGSFIKGLPIALASGPAIRALTAAGLLELPTVRLPRLALGALEVENLAVAVCPECGGEHTDGLLGLDVLATLGLELDFEAHVLWDRGCKMP